MKEVILGREGAQLFPIKSPDVSRRHARIIIDDHGEWTLEDLRSANGTYIQDDNGEYRQVSRIRIHEFTRIALGSTTKMGFTFLAHHILESDPLNYRAEMQHVVSLYESLQPRMKAIEAQERKMLRMRNLPPIVSAVLSILFFFLFPEYRMMVVMGGSLVTASLGAFINISRSTGSERKSLKALQTALIRCPNCNKSLSETEINNQMCSACRAHT